MKTLSLSLLALGSLMIFSSCETNTYESSSSPRDRATTTTTTEETTLSSPFNRGPVSTTVETQTTQAY